MHYGSILIHNLPREKSCSKMWPNTVIYKILPKENNRPIGENSPIRRKFAHSGHPAHDHAARAKVLLLLTAEPFFQSLSAARPLISVHHEKGDATKSAVCLPAVFRAPIRPDIVSFIHNEVSKNRRQPYSVSQAAGKLPSPIVFWNRKLRL
jgi:hypothetical protein